jgi:hypothetical protein
VLLIYRASATARSGCRVRLRNLRRIASQPCSAPDGFADEEFASVLDSDRGGGTHEFEMAATIFLNGARPPRHGATRRALPRGQKSRDTCSASAGAGGKPRVDRSPRALPRGALILADTAFSGSYSVTDELFPSTPFRLKRDGRWPSNSLSIALASGLDRSAVEFAELVIQWPGVQSLSRRS